LNLFAYSVSVRTIIELVKNRLHYIARYTNLIGSFDETLRRACNNNSFSKLYELVALGSALQCEIQSVYPYIDYRAEMKIMNAVYKPLDTSVLNNGRLTIFWTSNIDELSTKNRPGCAGIWSPNHFVPLIQQSRNHRTESNERVCATPEVKR
jgi:hypothetical protein